MRKARQAAEASAARSSRFAADRREQFRERGVGRGQKKMVLAFVEIAQRLAVALRSWRAPARSGARRDRAPRASRRFSRGGRSAASAFARRCRRAIPTRRGSPTPGGKSSCTTRSIVSSRFAASSGYSRPSLRPRRFCGAGPAFALGEFDGRRRGRGASVRGGSRRSAERLRGTGRTGEDL